MPTSSDFTGKGFGGFSQSLGSCHTEKSSGGSGIFPTIPHSHGVEWEAKSSPLSIKD